jgi:hypothetical protein
MKIRNERKWNGVPMSDETVQRYRQEAFEYLQDPANKPFSYTMCGDTLVLGLREDDCISIYHAKIQDSVAMVSALRRVWEPLEDYPENQRKFEEGERELMRSKNDLPTDDMFDDDLPF